MYNVDRFIKKFSAIPEELFCTQMNDGDKHCYMGHCEFDDAMSLAKLLWIKANVSCAKLVCGGYNKYNSPSLKQRILDVLNDIKLKQQKEGEEIIGNIKQYNYDKVYSFS